MHSLKIVGVVLLVGVGAMGLATAAEPTARDKAAAAEKKNEKKKAPPVWETFSSEDGKYSWTEPAGWVLDEAGSKPGVRMVWNEPEGKGGVYTIAAYPKTSGKLEDLVKRASLGARPRAQKAWMCAENSAGEQKIAVAARPSGDDYIMVVLTAGPDTFKKLGGLPGVRKAADGSQGFKSVRAEEMPGD